MKRYIVAGSIVMLSYGLTAMDPVTSHTLAPTPTLTAQISTLPETVFSPDADVVEKALTSNMKKEKSDYNENWSPSEKHKRAEALMSGAIFGECRGQGIYCMTAVGHVMMNRARANMDKRYGKGLWGVLNKRKQFSCLNKNDPNLKVIKKAMSGKLKPGTKDAERWKMAQDVAHLLMHRNEGDPTLGSVYYHATYMTPKWVKDNGMVYVTTIDGHKFYRKEG